MWPTNKQYLYHISIDIEFNFNLPFDTKGCGRILYTKYIIKGAEANLYTWNLKYTDLLLHPLLPQSSLSIFNEQKTTVMLIIYDLLPGTDFMKSPTSGFVNTGKSTEETEQEISRYGWLRSQHQPKLKKLYSIVVV